MTKHQYSFQGRFAAQPGRRDELAALLLQAADALAPNPDCLVYAIGVSGDDPDGVRVTEIWTSKDAHDAVLRDDAVKASIAKSMPLIAGVSDRVEQNLLGGKGV